MLHNYPANLCDLPDNQQEAIEQDKRDWLFITETFNQLDREAMQSWLNDQKRINPEAHKGYLEKANILFANQQQRLEASTAAMQEGLKEARQNKWGKSEEERLYSNG